METYIGGKRVSVVTKKKGVRKKKRATGKATKEVGVQKKNSKKSPVKKKNKGNDSIDDLKKKIKDKVIRGGHEVTHIHTDEIIARREADKAENKESRKDPAVRKAEKASYKKARSEEIRNKSYDTLRDISRVGPWQNFDKIDFTAIDWERRMACKKNPLLDLETYFPQVFYLGWSSFHKALVKNIEDKMQEGGKKSFGMPRASGKTAITRAMIIRATKFGMRKFAFFVGSKEDKAIQTLDFIRGYWFRSLLLRQDFPEIAYSVYRLEGRSGIGAVGQTYHGERTHVNWSTKEIQYPTLLLSETDVAGYLEHDPESVIYLPDIGIEMDNYVINSSGTVIRVAGIDGSIRGEAEIHPILLTQPRPDMVLLDDVQKDQKADSPKSCQDLERLIESAIDYLSAPDVEQAMLMPCTVIREGDVSDIYLNPLHKAEWNGERHGVISHYPIGIDDNVIMEEVNGEPNNQGILWNQYREIREQSFRQFGNLKLANEFFRDHEDILSNGFKVTWEQRFKAGSKNPDKNEVNALQSAMNARFKDHASFMSELQNKPRPRAGNLTTMPTAGEIMEHTTNIPQNEVSIQWTNIVCWVDVQDEILFYAIFAHDHNFNGQFIDYGTFPAVNSNYFRKSQTAGWSLLTRAFYRDNPDKKPPNVQQNRTTLARAPFEAKIYYALTKCCNYLLSREFPMMDEKSNHLRIRALAIDTQWGKSSEVIKRFVREYRDHRVICYSGNAFLPSHRQLEEYQPTPGWLFEHQQFPQVKESKWVVKPYAGGGQYILADVNRLKSFLMARVTSPIGSQGSVTLFQGQPDRHRMFADHIACSEYPEPIAARGITKDCWQTRIETRNDNDYLDCCTGCMCLASICGANLKTGNEITSTKQRSMREVYNEKKGDK